MVAQKVWVQALVWSTGCRGWVEASPKVGRGSKTKCEVGSEPFTIGTIKGKACVHVG